MSEILVRRLIHLPEVLQQEMNAEEHVTRVMATVYRHRIDSGYQNFIRQLVDSGKYDNCLLEQCDAVLKQGKIYRDYCTTDNHSNSSFLGNSGLTGNADGFPVFTLQYRTDKLVIETENELMSEFVGLLGSPVEFRVAYFSKVLWLELFMDTTSMDKLQTRALAISTEFHR